MILEHLMEQSDLTLEPLTPRPEPGLGVQNSKERKDSSHLHLHKSEEMNSSLDGGNRGGADDEYDLSSPAENDEGYHVTDSKACRLTADMNDNMAVWVGRIADLTAGYLPGDLSNIVRRAAGALTLSAAYCCE
jgi:hypothetical protein